MTGRKHFPLAAAIATTVALCLAAGANAADERLATIVAVYETAPRERVFDGTVEAVNRATVSSQTSGRVAEIGFDVDDFVEAGAPIMRFTDTEQRAALGRAEAGAREAEARYAEAESEHARVAAMFASGTVAKARYDVAIANFEAARARREAANEEVTAAREQLDYTIVRAPYAGIVAERHVEVGELVRPGQPLMSGLSLDQLRVSVDVPQGTIDAIRRIGKAQVLFGDRAVDAESLTFYPIADAAANTLRVRVNLPKGAAVAYPGTFVKVAFVVGETERLLVPSSAVVERSELTAVYVVTDESVLLRQIRSGRVYGDRIEVLAGLGAGERVALDPVAARAALRDRAAR